MASSKVPRITVKLSDLMQGKKLLGHTAGEPRKVSIVKMRPVINSKQLVIAGLAQGSQLYSLTMSLFDVQYSRTQSAAYPLTVSLGSGEYAYAKQIPLATARAQIRCQCKDFYFTWSWWDKQTKTLSGPGMTPYTRKTTTYPERNPSHVPGACKHVIGLVNRLRDLKIIKD